MSQGPLSGLKVLEFAGIGPGPFCGMLLSDLGADVVRIDRKGPGRASKTDITARGRKSVAMDLKSPAAVEACLKLMETADAVFEGFRPGVMERLGLGPDIALARNPKLVFGRMTGWGQIGPYSQAAGHDMNYIAISGALRAIGTVDKPTPPLNLVGDFGGGALYLAFGLLAGVIHARATGQGQVLNVSSVAGERPIGSSIPYACSKAALSHMTRLLAYTLGPEVRVNAVAPGLVDTPWTEGWTAVREFVRAEAPLRRSATPDDVAEVLVGLACATYVTGEVVLVDGGIHLR